MKEEKISIRVPTLCKTHKGIQVHHLLHILKGGFQTTLKENLHNTNEQMVLLQQTNKAITRHKQNLL